MSCQPTPLEPDCTSQESAEACALAAIAHELKGPLQKIGNLLYLIGNNSGSTSTQEWVGLAFQEVERINQITASLLEVSRQQSAETQFELAVVLENSIDSFQEKIAFKRITVEKRIECGGMIRSEPTEVRHIFDNVIANALEAMQPGGKMTVHLLDSVDWKNLRRRGCRMVLLDNGPGIPKEHSSKVFKPFFTTKLERGTGIGLWVVQRLVRKHGGSIRLHSSTCSNMRGTAFSIFFPSVA